MHVLRKLSLVVGVSLPLLASAAEAEFFQAPGTRRMAERLEKIAQAIHPEKSYFFAAERVEKYRPYVEAIQDAQTLFRVLPSYGLDLLNAGRTEEALRAFDQVEHVAKERDPVAWNQNR